MKKYPFIVTFIMLPILLVCANAADNVDELFSADGVLETIKSPERVSACPLKSINPHKKMLNHVGTEQWRSRIECPCGGFGYGLFG